MVVGSQELEVYRGHHIVRKFPVSTSRFGIGSKPGSFCTPSGKFAIAEKFGDAMPEGMIFVGRVPTGVIANQGGDEDHILTRILWLDGRDPDNANTHDRYIYIHGTNQESLIGTPASHGCIRMRGPDLIELYDRTPVGTPLEIVR